MKINCVNLKEGEYVKEESKKRSIVLHHTAGGKKAEDVVKCWNTDTRGKIGTAYVIGYDGTIIQCFDDKYWAYALGVTSPNYRELEKQSIQIEVCAYGFLSKHDNEYFNAYGSKVAVEEVAILDTPFKGFFYYHKYSDAQIASLKELVETLCKKHSIKGCLNRTDFSYSKNAMNGAPGFWTHNSFRADKSDIYPDSRILNTFKKGWHAEFSS